MTTGAERFTPVRPLGPSLLLVQDADGAPFVLKRLTGDRASDPVARHELQLEAWRVAQLEGPRFARTREDGTASGGAPFYTMAYAEGPPATLIPSSEAAACVRQVAEALAVLHAHGWVHAGLEPLQLRRTENGLVVVGYGNLTPRGQRARRPGAAAFQSPEQAAGRPLDGRADLYSLGGLIHFWLTGEAAGELDLLDLVADPLAELGRWLLAARPGDRPADVQTFLAALDRAVPGGAPSPAAPTAPWLVAPALPMRAQDPFEALLSALDAGESSWRCLVGEAGSGRTAWLARAAARARAGGWVVLEAAAAGPWAAPLAPWRGLWPALAALANERQPGLTERFEPRLGAHCEPPGEPPTGLGTPWLTTLVRERTLAAYAELWTACAPPGLVLLLDDWELADEASRLTLAALAARLGEVPILVVAASVAPVPGLQPIALPPLSPEEGRALVNGLLGAACPPASADALCAVAGGQPWFVETLLHAWVEQGTLEPPEHALPTPATWPGAPAALARLAASAVPEATSWMAGAYATLLGPLVTPDALLLAPQEPELLAPGLDALLCAGVLVRTRDAYRFSHPAFEAIYARVLPAPMQALAHRRLAAAGLARKRAPGERLAFAHHAVLADSPALVGPLAIEGARVALAAGAPETARALIDEGLVTLPGDDALRGSYMALSGEIARRAGELDEAVMLFTAARQSMSPGERQGVALALAYALVGLGQPAQAIEAWREAAGHAQLAGDMDALAVALAGLCDAQAALGQLDDALGSGEAALGVAAEAGPLPRAHAMAALGALLAASGRERQAEGIALMQRAAALLETEGDRPRLLSLQCRLAEAELARGELLFARDTARRARDLANEDAASSDAVAGGLLYARACLAVGDRAEALLEAQQAGARALQLGRKLALAEALALEGLALVADDAIAGAGLTTRALALVSTVAEVPLAVRGRLWLWHAEALLTARAFPEAANALFEAHAPIKQLRDAELEGARTFLLGEWAAATGDRERARQELRATLAQPNQWRVVRAALRLGQLALEAGARTEAAGWLEQARRGALALGAEALASSAEALERELTPGPMGAAGPGEAAERLERLFEEARSLVPALVAPARALVQLEVELTASRALNTLWERLFDAMDPREMAAALAEAIFTATPARRVFILDRALQPLAARARTGELPYEPAMVDAPLCHLALDSHAWQGAAGEAGGLALPLVTPRHVLGVLYVVGLQPPSPEGSRAVVETLAALAHAAALAIERLVVPAPEES